jgi:hypothetical protein
MTCGLAVSISREKEANQGRKEEKRKERREIIVAAR